MFSYCNRMRIENNYQIKPVNTYKYFSKPNIKPINTNITELQSYPQVYFVGKKILDKETQNNKLIKQINEILLEDNPDEEINITELNYRAMKILSTIERRANDLYAEAQLIAEDKRLNPQQKYNRGKEIINEIKRMVKMKTVVYVKPNYRPRDEKTDYALINKFKSALLNDNFNLTKVFEQHYAPLQDIKTLKELGEKYPHITIPKRPEEVIAKKLINTLTRDFYEELDEAFSANDKKTMQKLLSDKIMQLIDDNITAKTKEEKDTLAIKIIKPTIKEISARYYKLKNSGSFSSIPEFRKTNKNLLTENDLKLLALDYDDFVLTVIKEQYRDLKNPNDIVYSKNGQTIKVSSLRDSDYKFDKIPNRVKGLIAEAQKLRKSQRDYKNYTPEHFKKKLEFYADRFGDNEEYLELALKFHSCKFGKTDIEMLTKFLEQSDKVWDGDQTIDDLLHFVYKNSISPKDTELIDELERQRQIEQIKIENKKIAALNNAQNEFDNYMNILYAHNLNYLASRCANYRPTSIDKDELKYAKYITELFSHNVSGNKIKNKDKLESKLMRVTTYLDYLNTDTELLLEAQKYATQHGGSIDFEKAGQYILNAEFVKSYPQSLQYAQNKEILKMIVENTNQETAIEYLCKYDNYLDYSSNEKAKI